MSNYACSYIKGLSLSRTERKILLAIADQVFDDSGVCRRKQSALACRAGVSTRTFKHHLAVLQTRGIVRVHNAKGLAGGGRRCAPIELLGFRDAFTKKCEQNRSRASKRGTTVWVPVW